MRSRSNRKNKIRTLVKFKCCNTERLFTYPKEFSMCECGKSGYDVGECGYSRILGNLKNIEIIKDYVDK